MGFKNIEELKTKRIAVLEGGLSVEREVSFRTGAAVAKALKEAGYQVISIDVDKDVAVRLRETKTDVAFIALHGRYGEDGCIQGLLESMFIPYTGSGVLASAVAMDKVLSKHLYTTYGIPTPPYAVFDTLEHALNQKLPFEFPVVVKPSCEGSSVGVSICKTAAEYEVAVRAVSKYVGKILVEKFIKGREVQGAVLDSEALGVIEIRPAREFYDYEAKYSANSGTQYLYPAPLPPDVYQKVNMLCLQAHRSLGCQGATRTDAMVSENGDVWVLETNTLPGMTQTSLLPKIAAGVGLSFTGLCERLLLGAQLKA